MALGPSNDNLVKKFVDTVPPLAILKHNFHSVSREERPPFARRIFMERLRDRFLISSDFLGGNQNKNWKFGVNWQEEHCSAELKMFCNHNNKISDMLHKHK